MNLKDFYDKELTVKAVPDVGDDQDYYPQPGEKFKLVSAGNEAVNLEVIGGFTPQGWEMEFEYLAAGHGGNPLPLDLAGNPFSNPTQERLFRSVTVAGFSIDAWFIAENDELVCIASKDSSGKQTGGYTNTSGGG